MSKIGPWTRSRIRPFSNVNKNGAWFQMKWNDILFRAAMRYNWMDFMIVSHTFLHTWISKLISGAAVILPIVGFFYRMGLVFMPRQKSTRHGHISMALDFDGRHFPRLHRRLKAIRTNKTKTITINVQYRVKCLATTQFRLEYSLFFFFLKTWSMSNRTVNGTPIRWSGLWNNAQRAKNH